MTIRVVVDTNVLVAGLIGAKGPNREILRLCLQQELQPYVGIALYMEYCDLLNRKKIQALCNQTSISLQNFLDGVLYDIFPLHFYLHQCSLQENA